MSGPYDGRVSLRYAALGLLAQQPGSGYDLLKRFESSMANVWPATQSQLYGELNKLADAGLIEVADVGPRGRKEYRVTKAGRADLLNWLADSTDDPPFRSAGLLRIFLLSEMPPTRAKHYVAGVAEHADTERKRYEHIRDCFDWNDSDADFYSRAALELGIRRQAMEADWARWLIKQMDRRKSD